jgi:hypothetical protein
MKVLLAGDTHADMANADFLIEQAEFFDCSRIFQLGDWGYIWPNSLDMTKHIRLQEKLAEYGIIMDFLDGNHEWFAEWARIGLDINGLEAQALSPNLIYHPRGSVWEWDGVTFMAMGGAVSVDKQRRTEGLTWGPEETIKDADVERAISQGKVDVLFSHDSPELGSFWRLKRHLRENGMGPHPKLQRESLENRLQLARVVRAAQPTNLYHGHYHYSYKEHGYITERGQESLRIMGLDCNGSLNRQIYVFDTDEYKAGRQA